jgi:glyoxylase-like metal-dependent hydrolase (beta-lactamase superfamily II)
MSGWLRETSGAWVAMHPEEARTLRGGHDGSRWARDRAWLLGHGVPLDEVGGLVISPDRIAAIGAMAEPDRFLGNGDTLPLTDRVVHVVWTPGHTPGHVCLHDEGAGVLLTGDHMLPRITPNIGVHTADDDGDPLSAYLRSLDRTRRFRTEEALPAHEYRFDNIGTRADGLVAHHQARNAEIIDLVGRLDQTTAWTVAEHLTWSRGWSALEGMMRRMALAETIAHMHHLAAVGRLVSAGGRRQTWRLAEVRLTMPNSRRRRDDVNR